MFMNFMNFAFTLIFSLIIGLVMIIFTKKFEMDRELLSAFECGFDSADRGMLPFSLRFFLLANIFLIFDVELILLFPFLVKLIWVNLWVPMGIFSGLLLLLSAGLFYEWNQKMLEWVA